MKKVIITGATGMIGKGVLLECLDHKMISEVLTIGRNPTGLEHPKLKELIHQDFADFSNIKNQLSDYDACFFCLGRSAAGLGEEEYRHITYNYTIAPDSVVDTIQIGQAMINTVLKGYPKKVLRSKDILILSKK